MSHPRKQGRRAAAQQRRRRHKVFLLGGVVIGALVVVTAAVALAGALSGDDGDDTTGANTAPTGAWSATPFVGGPRLAVNQRDIDHGDVPYNHAVEATYRLRNVGDQPLTLGTPTVNILEGC